MSQEWHGGKGDQNRSDSTKYRKGYDLIDWNKGKKETVTIEEIHADIKNLITDLDSASQEIAKLNAEYKNGGAE